MDSSKTAKPKETLEPRRGDRVADSKWSANSIHTPPFSMEAEIRPSRSVPKLCSRETAGENLW